MNGFEMIAEDGEMCADGVCVLPTEPLGEASAESRDEPPGEALAHSGRRQSLTPEQSDDKPTPSDHQ